MYEEHPTFDKPEDVGTTIWRYLTTAKFVSLLSSGSLFFCRADKLGDPFEGSTPIATVKAREATFPGVPNAAKSLTQLAENTRAMPRYTAINCWHIGEHESAAMWKLYSPDGDGIAIRSTFTRLADSLRICPFPVYIGVVQYLDYDSPTATEGVPFGNLFYPFLRKRISFAHERELRAIASQFPVPTDRSGWHSARDTIQDGLLAPTELTTLITEVRVSPTAKPWYKETVSAITERFGLPCAVQQSDLGKPPYW